VNEGLEDGLSTSLTGVYSETDHRRGFWKQWKLYERCSVLNVTLNYSLTEHC